MINDIDFLIDIEKDWDKAIQKEIEKVGLKINKDLPLSIQYYQFLQRKIPIKQREVKYATGVLDTLNTNLKVGLEKFELSVKTGADLLPYQSKLIFEAGRTDHMYSTWRIQHFHLGTKKENNSIFIKRTGSLVYGIVTDDYVYVIGVFQHGHWADVKLLKTAYDNWPEIFEECQFTNITGVPQNEKDIKNFRKHNINSLVYDISG